MTEIEYKVADLINFSSQKQPIEFASAFDAIIREKLVDAVQDKKQEIAVSVFNNHD